MIDTSRPIYDQSVIEPPKNPKGTKTAAVILLIILIAGLVFTAWLFLRPSRTIELAEGKSFQFKNFIVKIDRISDSTCLQVAGFECQEWQKELGTQLQFRNIKTNDIAYEYLGLNTRPLAESAGLNVQLLSVDFQNKTVRIKLTKR